jgi:hypothetical protein
LLLGLHRHASSAIRSQSDGMQIWQSLDITQHLPEAHSRSKPVLMSATTFAVDEQGEPVAVLATSSPIANHVIGYSGPTQLLLIMDEANAVQAVKVLKSFDTPEHLQTSRSEGSFLVSIQGMEMGPARLSANRWCQWRYVNKPCDR